MVASSLFRLFASCPPEFWNVSSGKACGFEFLCLDNRRVLLRLWGVLDLPYFELLVKRIEIIGNGLDGEFATEELKFVIDSSMLEFILPEIRKAMFRNYSLYRHVVAIWIFATHDWTKHFCNIFAYHLSDIPVIRTDSLQEAFLLSVAYKHTASAPVLARAKYFNFWQLRHDVRQIGRLLVRSVNLPDVVLGLTEHAGLRWSWIHSNLIFLEVKQPIVTGFAELFASQLKQIIGFFAVQDCGVISLLLDIRVVTAGNIRVGSRIVSELAALGSQLRVCWYEAFPVRRLGLWSVGLFAGVRFTNVSFYASFERGYADALGYAPNTLGPSDLLPELPIDHLADVLSSERDQVYRADNILHRKLFTYLSKMLIPENQPEFVNETHVDFLAKELFTGLYLAATDLTQLYDKLKKEEVNVLEIRSRMLQLQFNPHFFFNCINSILGYMYEGDNHKADLVLVNFAQLIRQHFENNQREMVSLTDELDFLSKYVQLEQIRSSFGLEYDLYIPPDLKSQLYAYQIPTMIVQPMLEKVIWKQLAPKLATGKLWIRIAKEAECIVFTISDNGVHTPPSDSSTSDMRYMERISLYNSRFDHPITLDYFESKVDSGIANSLRMNLPFQSTKSV